MSSEAVKKKKRFPTWTAVEECDLLFQVDDGLEGTFQRFDSSTREWCPTTIARDREDTMRIKFLEMNHIHLIRWISSSKEQQYYCCNTLPHPPQFRQTSIGHDETNVVDIEVLPFEIPETTGLLIENVTVEYIYYLVENESRKEIGTSQRSNWKYQLASSKDIKGECGLDVYEFQVGVRLRWSGGADSNRNKILTVSGISRYVSAPVIPNPACATPFSLTFSWANSHFSKLCKFSTDHKQTIVLEIAKDAHNRTVASFPKEFPQGLAHRFRAMEMASSKRTLMFEDLEPKTWYWFRARCYQEGSNECYCVSDMVVAQTPGTVPGFVSDVHASYTIYEDPKQRFRNLYVKLDWKPPVDNGSEIVDYIVLRADPQDNDMYKVVQRTKSCECIFSAIATLSDVQYACNFKVHAQNSIGTGEGTILNVKLDLPRWEPPPSKRERERTKKMALMNQTQAHKSAALINNYLEEKVSLRSKTKVVPTRPHTSHPSRKRPQTAHRIQSRQREKERKAAHVTKGGYSKNDIQALQQTPIVWILAYKQDTRITLADACPTVPGGRIRMYRTRSFNEENDDIFEVSPEVESAALRVQSTFRGHADRIKTAKQKTEANGAAMKIQSRYRKVRKQKEKEDEELNQAALKIQKHTRRKQQQQQYKEKKEQESAAMRIQRQCRRRNQKREEEKRELDAAAVKIQRKCRSRYQPKLQVKKKQEEEELDNAAKKIQSQIRKKKVKAKEEKLKKEEAEYGDAARKIQNKIRARQAKTDFDDKKKAALSIQSRYRTHRQQIAFQKRVNAVVLKAAIKLQSRVRGHTIRQQFDQRKRVLIMSIAKIKISSCGVKDACGIYETMGIAETAKYIMQSAVSNSSYVVERSMHSETGAHVWTLKQISSEGRAAVLYINKEEGSCLKPPKKGWKSLEGSGMPPVFAYKTSESYIKNMTALSRDSIVVADCGCAELNGTYVHKDSSDNVPQYIFEKKGCVFSITRTPYAESKVWLLTGTFTEVEYQEAIMEHRPSLEAKPRRASIRRSSTQTRVYYVNSENGTDSDVPLENWTLAQHGQLPLPLFVKQNKK